MYWLEEKKINYVINTHLPPNQISGDEHAPNCHILADLTCCFCQYQSIGKFNEPSHPRHSGGQQEELECPTIRGGFRGEA
jgi:hypothetical protein